MYGTIARMQVRAGQENTLMAWTAEWEQQRDPRALGAVAEYIFKLDNRPNEYFMVAIFTDREHYLANANSPEQDAEYRRLRELLDADPEWNDGEVVYGKTFG